MEEFKENQEITCINIKPLEGNEVAPPLVEGNKYTVKQKYKCGCGQEHLDVGLISQYNWVNCHNCNTKIPQGDQIHWCHPSRFK